MSLHYFHAPILACWFELVIALSDPVRPDSGAFCSNGAGVLPRNGEVLLATLALLSLRVPHQRTARNGNALTTVRIMSQQSTLFGWFSPRVARAQTVLSGNSHLDRLPTGMPMFSFRAASTDPARAPEMWFAIASYLDSPRDVSAFTRTCKFFRDIARPALYTRIIWKSDTFEASANLLQREPELAHRVRRLELDQLAFVAGCVGHSSGFHCLTILCSCAELEPQWTCKLSSI